MIRFLIKGLLRDQHRSLFPVIVVALGVMLTVLMYCWITGILGDFIDSNARFLTGHVKVMTRAYRENIDQMPIDLALLDTDQLMTKLSSDFPDLQWVERIRFGGLLDAPDEYGETRTQGPTIGLAVDLLSEDTDEIQRLNIREALVRGSIPDDPGEILISEIFAGKLGISPGDRVTLLASTMYGAMSAYNFTVSGTVRFGITVMDRAASIMDITDVRTALDMENACSEILGYFKNNVYLNSHAEILCRKFNADYADSDDEFVPVMIPLSDQNGLSDMLEYMQGIIGIMISVFIMAMALVLWNTGLIGGLRRYGEMGVRLAIGESRGHVYRTLVAESIVIGILGSSLGTAVGLFFSYILQTVGIDIGSWMKNATMMLPNTIRASITPAAYYIGFLPGLFATIVGTSLSGLGIYRRQTARLFKELEV